MIKRLFLAVMFLFICNYAHAADPGSFASGMVIGMAASDSGRCSNYRVAMDILLMDMDKTDENKKQGRTFLKQNRDMSVADIVRYKAKRGDFDRYRATKPPQP